MHSEYSTEYLELLASLSDPYRQCLDGFVKEFRAANESNLKGVILYGGLVRDRTALPKWSDIDIAVIYQKMSERNIFRNTTIKQHYEQTFQIRIDLNEIDSTELSPGLISIQYHSEFTNALAFREQVSISIFQEHPVCPPDMEFEKRTAIFYINDTLFRYRKYLNENDFAQPNSAALVPRVVRWYFSIVRASLRLLGIYSAPYEESIEHLKEIAPFLDLSVLEELAVGRRDGTLNQLDDQSVPILILRIDQSLNSFINFLNEVAQYENLPF